MPALQPEGKEVHSLKARRHDSPPPLPRLGNDGEVELLLGMRVAPLPHIWIDYGLSHGAERGHRSVSRKTDDSHSSQAERYEGAQ